MFYVYPTLLSILPVCTVSTKNLSPGVGADLRSEGVVKHIFYPGVFGDESIARCGFIGLWLAKQSDCQGVEDIGQAVE